MKFTYPIVLFAIFTHKIVICCNWANNITVRSTLGISGNGFHRSLNFAVYLSNVNRFIDCSLVYKLTIPNGAHLELMNGDLLQNAENNQKLVISTDNDVDIQALAEKAHKSTAYLCSDSQLFNNFLFSQIVEVPLRIRYHKAIEHDEPAPRIHFDSAEILIRCETEDILKEKSCKKSLIQAPCDCRYRTHLCSYLKLNPTTIQSLVSVEIPVGKADQLIIVTIVTLLIVFLSSILLLFFLF